MAAVIYARGFLRTAAKLTGDERAAVLRTAADIEAAEVLPLPTDAPTLLPPSLPVWRRPAGASGRYVYFTVRADGVAVLVAVGGYL